MEGPEKLPEKLPGPDRIVGMDEIDEEKLKLLLTKSMMEQEFESFEREKTLEEREIFYAIIEKIPNFIKEYGAERTKFFLANQLHILDESKQNSEQVQRFLEKGIGGTYSSSGRIDILSTDGEYLKTAHTLVHELIHANSFDSSTVKILPQDVDAPLTRTIGGRIEKISLKHRRFGLEVFEKGENKLFTYLNEAITEELTRRFCERYFNDIPHVDTEFAKYSFENKAEPIEVPAQNNLTLDGLNETSNKRQLFTYIKERTFLGLLV